MHYSAFISYRRSDGTKAANWLRDALQSYRLPKKLRGGHADKLRIFLDTAYERGAHHFYEKTIQPALLASDHLIVLATPDAVSREGPVQDDWMAREINDFSQGPNAENLIVVRGAGDFDGPLPTRISEVYPNAQIIDLRGVTDLNFFNFGRSAFFDNEKIKIVAALHDVPLDSMPILRQEAERRRQARFGLFAGIGVAAISLSVGLSIYSIRAQILGQRSIDESLISAEAIVKDISERLWKEKDFKRLGDPAIRAACQVANRLALRATQERSPSVAALCDMEYAIQDSPQRNPDPDVPYFAGKELARLTGHSASLLAEHAELDLEEVRRRARLAFSVRKFRNRFHFAEPLERYDTEVTLAREVAETLASRVTHSADGEAKQAAAKAAFEWYVLVVDENLKRTSALHKTTSRGVQIDALEVPLRTEEAVAKLVKAGELTPEDTSDYYGTLHLVTDLQGSFLVEDGKPEEAAGKYKTSLDYLRRSSPGDANADTDWQKVQRWDVSAKLAKIETANRDFPDRFQALHAIFADMRKARKRLGDEQHSNRESFWEVWNRIVETLHEILDGMRRDADTRAEGGDLSTARSALAREVEWRRQLYRDSGDTRHWAKLFVMIGEQKLAAVETRMGNHAQAERRRLGFYRKQRALGLKPSSLDGRQLLDFAAARRAVSEAHDAHLHRLRSEAAAHAKGGDHKRAIDGLTTLRTDGRAWDMAGGGFSETARVHGAEIGFELADSLDAVSARRRADRVRTRVVREFLPLLEKHSLSGNWLKRANDVWRRAAKWLDDRGLDHKRLEPIAEMAPFGNDAP